MSRLIEKHLLSVVFGLLGLVFGGVGLVFLAVTFNSRQNAALIESLPLLSVAEMATLESGAPGVIEGRVSERNSVQRQGLAAYVQRQYRGLECDTDDSDDDDGGCREVWVEVERVTPALWLDLPDGRLRLANSDYQLYGLPETWQSTDFLIEDETRRYEGFRLGSPVFASGVVNAADGVTFKADFIFGGSRQEYLVNQQLEAGFLLWFAVIFGGFGLVFTAVAIGAAIRRQ